MMTAYLRAASTEALSIVNDSRRQYYQHWNAGDSNELVINENKYGAH